MANDPRTWPIEPDALGQAPSLEEIAVGRPELAPLAQLLTETAERLRARGARSVAYQQVMDTPLGPVTVPCFVETDDAPIAVYPHAGAFDPEDLKRLTGWAQRVRGRWLDTVEIELATDAPAAGLGQRAREVVANAPASILGLLASRRFTPDPAENAAVLAGACEAILGFEPRADRAGLVRLDESLALLGAIGADFVFRGVLIGLYGAFLGEALLAAGAASWGPPAIGKPDWWKTLDTDRDAPAVRGGKLDPMEHAASLLDAGKPGLVALFDALAPREPAPPRGPAHELEPSAPGELRPNAARRIYGVLAHLAACDGEVAAAERAVLRAYREQLEIAPPEAEQIERDAASGKVRIGKDPEERRVLSGALLEIIMADGRVDEQERLKLARIVKAVGLTKDELGPLLRFCLKGGK